MPIQAIQDSAQRANTKYRRVRTLIKNCVEVAGLCDIKINLVISDKNGNYVQENFTDAEFTMQALFGLIKFDDGNEDGNQIPTGQNGPKIQINSRNA